MACSFALPPLEENRMKIILMPVLVLLLLVSACTTNGTPSRLSPYGWGGPGEVDPRVYDGDPAFRQWYDLPYINPYVQ